MIYQLIKRDLSWKTIPWATSALILVWLFSLLMRVPSEILSVIAGAFLSVLLVLTIGMASNQDIWSSLLSALPVTPREIYLARVLALLTLLWMPVFADTALQAAMRAPTGIAPLPALGAFATLLAIAIQSALMTGVRLPRWLVMTVVFVSVGLPIELAALRVRLEPYAVPFAAICLAGAATIFLRTWNAINGKPLATTRKPDTRPVTARLHARPHSLLFIRLRYLYSWTELLWVPMLFSQAAIGVWLNGILFLWSLRMIPSRRWLDPLPVSRRILLLAGILPPLLSLTAGYLTGTYWGGGSHSRFNDISETTSQGWPPSAEQRSCGRINITPPLEYWELSKNGSAETVSAPWGENFTPPVTAVMSTSVYNPYAVGCANTQRFFDWQFARATSAVYGRPVTLRDFVRHRHPNPRTQARLVLLNVCALLFWAMLTFALVALKDWYRCQRLPSWVWKVIFVGLLLTAMALVFGSGPFGIQDYLQWLSWRLPENLAVLITICAVPTLLFYLLLEKLTREAELSPAPAQNVNFMTQFQR
jgi:hypothetical protein